MIGDRYIVVPPAMIQKISPIKRSATSDLTKNTIIESILDLTLQISSYTGGVKRKRYKKI